MLEARFAGRNQHGVDVPDVAFDAAVLFLPKSRELAAYLLNALASRLAGRELYLVGEKRGGIEGAAKQLQAFGKPRKLDSARHCQLWQVTVENAPQAKPLESLAERFELELADGPLKIVSLPGVFSHGRLDRGTALLLEHLDGLPVGHVLDFGCGAGVIGSIIKRRYPDSQVTLLDVDAFAVASSRLTLAANGLQGEVISGDGIDAAPRDLQVILSNPPFHTGVHTNYQASENLLKKSAEHLRSGGELRLVANTFLRYQPFIQEALGNCRTLTEAGGFRIYQAKRG
jgi:16S rRNA (guanine1207-N2)-methyltransferase